jgi:hypothetical protein
MYRRMNARGFSRNVLECLDLNDGCYVITPFSRPAFMPSPFRDLLSRLVHHLPSCTFPFRLSFFRTIFFRPPSSAFYLRPSSVTFPASVVLASRPQHPASIPFFPAFPTPFPLRDPRRTSFSFVVTDDCTPVFRRLPFSPSSPSPPLIFFLAFQIFDR